MGRACEAQHEAAPREREMAAGSTQVDAALKVAARRRSFAGLTSMTSAGPAAGRSDRTCSAWRSSAHTLGHRPGCDNRACACESIGTDP